MSTSPEVVSPCVTQARITGLPSNIAVEIHAFPEASTRPTICSTPGKAGGGSKHSTAAGEALTIRQPRRPGACPRAAPPARSHARLCRPYPAQPAAASDRKSRSPRNRRDPLHRVEVRVAADIVRRHVAGGDAERADSTSGRRVRNMPQPIVTANHLCASMVSESAASMPASRGAMAVRARSSAPPRRHRCGTTDRGAARSRRSARAGRSSRHWSCRRVATTITGANPAARSAAIVAPAPPDRAAPSHRSRSSAPRRGRSLPGGRS